MVTWMKPKLCKQSGSAPFFYPLKKEAKMIDWFNLVMNSFWILGCSIALATLSYASWEASTMKDKFIIRLKQPGYQISLNIAGLLFCIGLAGTSDVVWQQILWGLLGLGFVFQIFMEIKRIREKMGEI